MDALFLAVSRLWEQGLPQNEIARRLNISHGKVTKILLTIGAVETRESQLLAEGLTIDQIAARLKKSKQAVSARLPYSKGHYDAEYPTINAIRIKQTRARQSRRGDDGDASWSAMPGEPPEIAEIRHSTGLSQAAFAARHGIPRRTVEDWESGARKCSGWLRLLLAEVEGVAPLPAPIAAVDRQPETVLELRQSLGLSRSAFAARHKISYFTVSKWDKQLVEAPPYILPLLVQVERLSYNTLLTDTQSPEYNDDIGGDPDSAARAAVD